jgi:hypothetical protein
MTGIVDHNGNDNNWRDNDRIYRLGGLLMPFKSAAQQRYLESDASPLTAKQKKEWESSTDFKSLPERKSKGRKVRRRSVEQRGKKNQST